MPETRERWRFRLPHWEVSGRPHFVTIRCAGSLPAEVLAEVRAIHETLQSIDAASPEFVVMQRRYFLACERHLDRGEGFAPFRDAKACRLLLDAWTGLSWETATGWRVSHGVVMPNHVHFILHPAIDQPRPLRITLPAFKGRAA